MEKNLPVGDTVIKPGIGWWDATVGAIIIAIGLALGVWGLNVSDAIALPGILVCLLVGSILVWAGILPFFRRQPAYDPRPSFTPQESGESTFHPREIHPGVPFQFAFRQPVERPTQIDGISIFLIFRETVSLPMDDGRETKVFDRLFQQHLLPASLLRKGDGLTAEATFQIPGGEIGVRNCFRKRLCDWHSFVAYGRPKTESTQWLVKINIRFADQMDYWQTFPVEIVPPPGTESDRDEPAEGYDVFLGRKQQEKGSVVSAILPFLPHLEAEQVGDLVWARPCLLRERMTKGMADEMKGQLKTIGPEVVILPAHLMSEFPEKE